MANREFFKEVFDGLAVNGCIGDPNGRPAYAYIRVSSDKQADEDRSGLPRQIQHCHEIALQKGYRIAWDMVFADDFTGFEFENRPALSSLRKEYRSSTCRANVVVIEHLDRLSRNADWHQGFLLDEMKLHGMQPVFWKAFSSRIEQAVMGAIAQDGMEQAKERMREGMLNKAKHRKCVTAKQPAQGLKLVDPDGNEKTMAARRNTQYAIDENGSVLIRYIYEALAYQDVTAYILVNWLDALSELDERYRPPRAKGWSEGRIVQLVRNPVYKGEFIAHRYYRETVATYNEATGTYKKTKVTRERPEHEWIKIPVPAIVDPATWDLANRNLSRNKHRAPRNRKRDYLLSGLVRCAACGWSYHGQYYTKAKKSPRYCCSKTTHIAKQRREPRCGASSICCDTLDNAVWRAITEDLTREKVMRAIDARYSGEEAQAHLKQIAYLEGKIADNIHEEQKERELYLVEGYTAEEFAGIRRALVGKREKLQADLNILRAQVLTPEEIDAKKRETLQLVEEARQRGSLQDAPYEVKRRMIKTSVDEISLNAAEGLFEIRGDLGAGIYAIEDGSAVTIPASRSYQRTPLRFRLVYSLHEQAITNFQLA